VVSAACQKDIDLLITHHPLIFNPLRSVDFGSAPGKSIQMAARNQLAIFAAHTNFDSAAGGLNDALARKIGLTHLKILDKTGDSDDINPMQPSGENWGLGRIGDLAESQDLRSFALDIKKKLGLTSVKVTGDFSLIIDRAAVCTGSGSSLMNAFLAADAQAFISGDLRYHDAKNTQTAAKGLIDIGHFASEHLIVDVLTQKLTTLLKDKDVDVTVKACRLEKDPFVSL
jgi:dinuclear metal center YbgI/SA1388 family protein